MRIEIIRKYLQTHRRLVVPQLGAFIRKEPDGQVLFTALLKRDDGVLRGLLAQDGAGEIGAAGEIDRFVFEVRHAMQQGRPFPLEGFGVLRPGPGGVPVFEPAPGGEAHASDPDGQRPEASDASEGGSAPADHAAETPAAAGSPADAPGADAGRASGKPQRIRPERIALTARQAFADERAQASRMAGPDPSLRGLRYGKPRKNTDAYTYVGHSRRRVDRFIWIALAAVLLSLAAIAYGFWREARDRDAAETAAPRVEQTLPSAPTQGSAERTPLPAAAALRSDRTLPIATQSRPDQTLPPAAASAAVRPAGAAYPKHLRA